jgi:hypothetical protein
MEHERVISYERGKTLADELNIEFFETSAKDNHNVKVGIENKNYIHYVYLFTSHMHLVFYETFLPPFHDVFALGIIVVSTHCYIDAIVGVPNRSSVRFVSREKRSRTAVKRAQDISLR